MKIADVTVGTEYAYLGYSYDGTDHSRLERANRVLVTAIHPGGKVSIDTFDRTDRTFKRFSSRPVAARGLIMPWADAQPIYKEIRQRRAADTLRRKEQQEREQVALRALGEFLENHDALGMPGLPWTLKGSIALANGDEGLKDFGALGMTPTHRHEPKVEVNVITLVTLLRKAYADGREDRSAEPRVIAPWSQEVS